MYPYLCRVVGMRLAVAILAVTYSAMILAILYCIFEPEAQLHYLAL